MGEHAVLLAGGTDRMLAHGGSVAHVQRGNPDVPANLLKTASFRRGSETAHRAGTTGAVGTNRRGAQRNESLVVQKKQTFSSTVARRPYPPADAIVREMVSRRTVLLSTPVAMAARPGAMSLCLHQTTSAAAGYRRSLEGYAKAGIKFVEVIPPHLEEFVKKEGMPAAKRLLSDLGLKAVSSGGVRGLAEPSAGRAKALEQLKTTVELVAGL